MPKLPKSLESFNETPAQKPSISPGYLEPEHVFLTLEKGWCPPSLLRHFYDQVHHANGRRYSKDEAVASLAIDIHMGRFEDGWTWKTKDGRRVRMKGRKLRPVRYYAKIWRVPSSTVGDWMPRIKAALRSLITMCRGIDHRRENDLVYSNPDKKPEPVVNNYEPAPGSRRHWSTALAHLAAKIRTYTKVLLLHFSNSPVETVENLYTSPVTYTWDEAIAIYDRDCFGAGGFHLFFEPCALEGQCRYRPTELYRKRRAWLDGLPKSPPEV